MTAGERFGMLEVPRPIAAAGEVMMRCRAKSLNYRDQAITKGHYFGGPIKAACTPLSDGTGVVEAVGANVKNIAVGDRVAGTFFQGWSEGPPTPALGEALGAPPAKGILAGYVALPVPGALLGRGLPALLSQPCLVGPRSLCAWGHAVRGFHLLPAVSCGRSDGVGALPPCPGANPAR